MVRDNKDELNRELTGAGATVAKAWSKYSMESEPLALFDLAIT